MDVSHYVNKVIAAKANVGGNVIRDGSYTLAVRNLKIEPSQKGPEAWFKGELYVVESAPVNVDASMMKPGETLGAPNPVGSDATFITDIAKQVGQSNVKSFMCALLGKSEAEVDADPKWFGDEMTKAVGISQPYRGRVLAVSSYRKPIKGGANAGKPFTGYNWRPYAATEEDIAELRTLLSK